MALGGLALLLALQLLLAGCQTDRDPRTGGFFDGVDNLVSGGYDGFVQDKRNELEATQEEARVLEARSTKSPALRSHKHGPSPSHRGAVPTKFVRFP